MLTQKSKDSRTCVTSNEFPYKELWIFWRILRHNLVCLKAITCSMSFFIQIWQSQHFSQKFCLCLGSDLQVSWAQLRWLNFLCYGFKGEQNRKRNQISVPLSIQLKIVDIAKHKVKIFYGKKDIKLFITLSLLSYKKIFLKNFKSQTNKE